MLPFITNFPDAYLSDLFSVWVTIVDVAQLDSALCAHSVRKEFMDAAYNSDTVLQYSEKIYEKEDIDDEVNAWLFLRSACVSGLNITPVFILDQNSRQQYLWKYGSGMRWVQSMTLERGSTQHVTTQTIADVAHYCRNLTRIDLVCSHVSEGCLVTLVRSQQHLRALSLLNRKASAVVVRELALSLSAASLEELKLTAPQLTFTAVCFLLKQCVRLRKLTLLLFRILPSDGDSNAAATNDSMREIILDGGELVALDQLECILRSCPSLTKLEISPVAGMGYLRSLPVGAFCPSLVTLSLVGYRPGLAGDPMLFSISAHCPHLRVLIIPESTDVTDAALSAVAAGCPLLEELNLDGMNITDVSLLAIAQHCHNLVLLNVSECREVSDDGVLEIMENCTKLAGLGVLHCLGVPFELRCKIQQNYKFHW
jgi:hypothetical protein